MSEEIISTLSILPNFMGNTAPTTLFVLALGAVTLLLIIFLFSIHYYNKAKDLVPFWTQKQALLAEIVAAQKTLAELKDLLREKENESARADRVVAEGKAAQEWLEQNRPQIEEVNRQIDSAKRNLQTANDEYTKRQDELNGLTQQVADKNVEEKNLTEKKDALEIQIAKLQETGKVLETTSKQQEEKIETLGAEIESITRRKNELAAIVADLEKKEREYAALKQACDEQRTMTAELKGEAAAATANIAEWNKHREDNKEHWADLERPCFPDVKSPTATDLDEKKWLDDFTKQLEKADIKFNVRTLKAFHTGLKCADISPLVVLAGISGTGKSLLPELYAAALGMNFLSIAVQPRWDSPQDMFGFFNYMEGRYKATELSRLLWQFDRYNNEKANEKYARHPQELLNLVLLDEMNLARVEYYFSDLLSKLETRRGLNFDDNEERRRAEIEIESNAAKSEKQTHRLFVAPNTLFVGTMNEDESTQMLSDKVLDRANVLRFGRPEHLGAKPKKDDFLRHCATQPKITSANWEKWRQPHQQHLTDLRTWLKDVNPIMEKVGRPFAHRVWQAIESYITLYPGDTTADFQAALADQIEMKILPKLNGLELELAHFAEVQKALTNVIDKTEDERLREAFASACNLHQHVFFKWRGVMR